MRDFIGKRKLWKHKGKLNRAWKGVNGLPVDDREEVVSGEDATLISSSIGYDIHLPVLDIDYPAALVPSSTPGHFHLYLNREVTWDNYVGLLWALYKCGLIEEGFFKMSIARGQSFVRFPGVRKQPGEEGSS